MNRAGVWMRSRWSALLTYWLTQLAVLYVLTSIAIYIFIDGTILEKFPLTTHLSTVGVLMVLQIVFVWPIRRPGLAVHRRSLWLSLIVAGLLVGMLTSAGVFALMTATAAESDELGNNYRWILLGVLASAWLVSTPLLIVFCRRGRRETILQRLSARLFLGTVIEAAAIIPLDVMVRRRSDCVCWTGTYVSLAICGIVGAFVLGPAVFLPLIAHRRRRWYAGRCDVCGYDVSSTPDVDRCPECGAGWRGVGDSSKQQSSDAH